MPGLLDATRHPERNKRIYKTVRRCTSLTGVCVAVGFGIVELVKDTTYVGAAKGACKGSA